MSLLNASTTSSNIRALVDASRKIKSKEADQQVELKSTHNLSLKPNVLKDSATHRSDREIGLAHFKYLLSIFKEASNNSKSLNFDQFQNAFSNAFDKDMSESQMRDLFNKIDANTDNLIDWDDFSEFMLLRAEGQKQMKEEAETQTFIVEQGVSSLPMATPHKDMICKIHYSYKSKRFVTVSRDGTVCYWSDHLRLVRSFKNVGFKSDKSKSMNASKQNLLKQLQQQRWSLDFLFMENLYSLAIATDDHEICIYDTATMEKTHCLNLKDSCAMTLEYWTDKENTDSEFSKLFYGTDSGFVCVYDFPNKLFSDRGPRKKDSFIELNMELIHTKPARYFGTLQKYKAHGDWVSKVRYYDEMKGLVSCSPDPKDSLVLAKLDKSGKWSAQSVSVQKGVHAFAYCSFPVALVTGGTDKIIRIWNPRRLNSPTASLRGHNSPITDIKINSLNGQILSLSIDKMIKIWDIRKQQCLQTIIDNATQRPDNIYSSIIFNAECGGRMIAASSLLRVYTLKEKLSQVTGVKSHEYPIRNLLYNIPFGLVVSGDNGGTVNVWDAMNGIKNFRFSNLHGNTEITAMSFDPLGRRLLSGGRDGTVKVWNFNNGQQIQELVKDDGSEVTDIANICMQDVNYIVVTGWNRKLIIFEDQVDQYKLYPYYVLPFESQESIWHKDDILSMTFCQPNMMATSSYDGIIVLTNIMSGHILYVLDPNEYEDDKSKNRSIDKVMALAERETNKEAASLVSAGSDGILRFWNIHKGILAWKWDGSNGRSEGIYCMKTTPDNDIMVTCDAGGWVILWDISNFCLNEGVQTIPSIITEFRAHVKPIVGLDICERTQSIFTSSSDCTVRMFTFEGEFIGIFGRAEPWDIYKPDTWCHPSLPKDIQEVIDMEAEEQEALERLQELQLKMRTEENLNSLKKGIKSVRNYLVATSVTKPLVGESLDKLRAKLKTADLLSPNINTWYGNTIYAKELVVDKLPKKRVPQGAQAISKATKDKEKGISSRLYQYLDPYELESIKLPSIKGKIDLK